MLEDALTAVVVRVVVVDVLYIPHSFLRSSPISHSSWVYGNLLLPPFFVWLPAAGSTPPTDGLGHLSNGPSPSLVWVAVIHHPSAFTYHSLSIAVWLLGFCPHYHFSFSFKRAFYVPFVDASSCRISERSLHNAISTYKKKKQYIIFLYPTAYRSHVIVVHL